MRVLIVTPDNIAHLGGKATHIIQLQDGLEKLGHEVKVLSARDIPTVEFFIRGGSFLFNKIRLGLGTVYSITMRRIWINRLIHKLLKSGFVPDIINVHTSTCVSNIKKLNLSIPIILTEHGYANEYLSDGKMKEDSFTYRFVLNKVAEGYNHSDFIVSVDTRLRNRILEFSSEYRDKIEIVFNAVNTDEFSPVESDEKISLCEEVGFDKTSFILFCPRRLVRKNGVIFPVMALKLLRERSPEVNTLLVYAGDGPERENIEQYINENNLHEYVRLLGSVDHSEMAKYYLISDAVIIPSVTSEGVQEATSISALEGMSCGKPVIVSGIGGLKELVTDEYNGLIVNEKSPEDIANAWLRLIGDSNLQHTLGQNARRYVVEKHSHLSHAKRISEIYELVAKKEHNLKSDSNRIIREAKDK